MGGGSARGGWGGRGASMQYFDNAWLPRQHREIMLKGLTRRNKQSPIHFKVVLGHFLSTARSP